MSDSNYRTGSIYNLLQAELYNRGLFEDQAKAVMQQLVKADAEGDATMKARWNDLASDYPEIMMRVLLVSAFAETVKWIDANNPHHWARSMFVSNQAPVKAPEHKPPRGTFSLPQQPPAAPSATSPFNDEESVLAALRGGASIRYYYLAGGADLIATDGSVTRLNAGLFSQMQWGKSLKADDNKRGSGSGVYTVYKAADTAPPASDAGLTPPRPKGIRRIIEAFRRNR